MCPIISRDYWTQVIDIELPPIVRLERQGGGAEAIDKAAKLLSNAKFPVILSGAGVVIGGAIEETKKLAEKLDSPVCSGYQHNDSFPENYHCVDNQNKLVSLIFLQVFLFLQLHHQLQLLHQIK